MSEDVRFVCHISAHSPFVKPGVKPWTWLLYQLKMELLFKKKYIPLPIIGHSIVWTMEFRWFFGKQLSAFTCELVITSKHLSPM